MTCKDCQHYDVCNNFDPRTMKKRLALGDGYICKNFRVRCCQCRYWTGNDYDGCCLANGLITRYANDYCSYGERSDT